MTDWIVAAATPPARSALAVVRISGSALAPLRDRVTNPLHPGPWRPGRTRRVALIDAEGPFDDGLAVFSAAPRSYTGEDTLEVTLHGNPLLVERLIAACTAAGCRLAQPGEFTRRAVLHGKLSLLAAEAVDLTIRSTSVHGITIARQVEQLSTALLQLRAELIQVMAELEARLDYPADELALESDAALVDTLAELGARARALAATHRQGERLIEGATVALVGPVNVGKSSLFNALLGQRRALVHDGPGTTRDVVESRMRLGALEVRLLDTAGERETDDPIEAAGLALAGDLIDDADLLLLVGRAGVEDPVFDGIVTRTAGRARVITYNQVDRAPPGTPGISTLTGAGLDALRAELIDALGAHPPTDLILASARQAELCGRIDRGCAEGAEALEIAGVAVALDVLTEALEALDQLTGADSREDVLDALFARFCIGK